VNSAGIRFILFDWGDTLMSEDGPVDIAMVHWQHVRAIEGASEVVAALAKRYTLAIVTNATVSKRLDIVQALERVGLATFFSEIFCYTEIGRKKDEPEFWQVVLTRLGALPNEVIVIGDSFEQDVLGPMKCDIQAIWFGWKNQTASIPRDCRVIHKLSDLSALLQPEKGE
jgi:putative hydrolase of the HAD superfamily